MTHAPSRMTLTAFAGVALIAPGDDLAAITRASATANGERFANGDVLVFAQKIVSKSEGRRVALADVTPSPRARALAATTGKDARLVELILHESRAVMRALPGLIIVRHRLGFVLANAGIDASNVAGDDAHVLLLPRDPDASAGRLRAALGGDADVAVIINDSLGRAWRQGTVGTALGAAGLAALDDRRGTRDLYGRELRATEVGLADELAAAASHVMGQGAEGRPIVLIRGAAPGAGPRDAVTLLRGPAMDLFP